MQRLLDMALKPETADAEVNSRLQEVAPKYYLSSGQRGRLLESLRELGYHQRTITVALSALLHKDDEIQRLIQNAHWSYHCIAGIASVAAFDAGGDPQRLVSLIRAMEDYQRKWDENLELARTQTAKNQEAHTAAVTTLQASLSAAEAKVNTTVAEYEKSLQDIRAKFEEQFALRTPMTYWTDKAARHSAAAVRYRRWFTTLMFAGVAILGGVGYFALFPFLQGQPDGYWALILFSVGIALLAWPLRLTSKQYLVHQQLYEDAEERAVIAQTFLALGDAVKLTEADRQLLLV